MTENATKTFYAWQPIASIVCDDRLAWVRWSSLGVDRIVSLHRGYPWAAVGATHWRDATDAELLAYCANLVMANCHVGFDRSGAEPADATLSPSEVVLLETGVTWPGVLPDAITPERRAVCERLAGEGLLGRGKIDAYHTTGNGLGVLAAASALARRLT